MNTVNWESLIPDLKEWNNGKGIDPESWVGCEGWAAAGLVDTDLSFLSLLELYGTEISERRMPTRRVVEALDVVEHI